MSGVFADKRLQFKVSENRRRAVEGHISLQTVARWQAEPLQSSELTSGEKFHMQHVEEPVLEQVIDLEKGHDYSEQD